MLDADFEIKSLQVIDFKNLIKQLPERQRVIVALIFSGYKRRECAELVGLSHGTITSIYNLAIKSLKELIINGS